VKFAEPSTRKNGRPESASILLTGLAATWPGEHIRLIDIIDVLKERVYGLLFLILAIPNMIPGVALLLGLPLVIVAGQLVLGWPKPRLPKFIGERKIPITEYRRFIAKAEPWLKRAERMLRPRGLFIFGKIGERVLGLVVLMLAIVLTLPIWGANFLPALAICLIALALIEFDGLMAVFGLVIAGASVVVALAVIWGAVKVAWFLVVSVFF
jgi:hypothetical protein